MSEPVPAVSSQEDDLGSSGKSRPKLKRTEANVALANVISGSPPSVSSSPYPPPAASASSTSTSSAANLASILSPVNPDQGPVTAFAFIKKSPTGFTATISSELTTSLGVSESSSKVEAASLGASPVNISSPFGSAALSSSPSRKLKPKDPKDKVDKSHKKEKKSASLTSSTAAAPLLTNELVPPLACFLSSPATEPEWACMPDLRTTNKLDPISTIRISLVQRALSQLKPPAALVLREPRWELMPPLTAKFQEMWRTRTSTIASETNSLSVPIGGSVSGTSPQRDRRMMTMFDLPPAVPSRANFKGS